MSEAYPILEVSTVVGCRLRCSYCPQGTHIRRYAAAHPVRSDFVMTLGDFKDFLLSVPREVEIAFAGMAEPWLNPAATDMVLHAAECHRVAVFTTTVGLLPSDVSRLRYVQFKQFCIHLPDADGKMKLDVDSVYLAGLEAALEIPNRHFTVLGKLHPKVRDLLGHDVRDDSAGLISRAGNLGPRPSHAGKIRCGATTPGRADHNVLLPNGDVVLCCCDYSLSHILGNLLRGGYPSIFKSAGYRHVMSGWDDPMIGTICRNCELAVPA
jgi:hypothetical protein